jgi:hypothetical protein
MPEWTVSFKTMMGALSVVIMTVAYAVYLWQTARSQDVRPHPFSWLLWGFVTAVVYLVQIGKGAGPGSWVVGLTAVFCFVIGIISFLKHKWRFSWFDWLSLIAGLLVFGYYLLSKNPIQSAILATATDVIGYGSTVRQGWTEPDKDSATSFALNSLKFVPSLFALQTYSVATWLYPATLVVMNGAVTILLLTRRRRLGLSMSNTRN